MLAALRHLPSCLFAATILFVPAALPVHAQSGNTPASEAAPSATIAPEAPAAEPPPGSSYLAQVHGAWSQLCTVTPDGSAPCELYQLLKDERGTSVAEITIVDLPPEASTGARTAVAGAMLVTPLETYLPAQIRIRVDDGPEAIYRFEYCASVGCVSRIGFTEEELNALRRGRAAIVSIAAAADPSRPVRLEMSLAGFTAGFAAVQTANAAAGK